MFQVRALTQQKLQHTNDDRLPRACFSGDGEKPWADLPLDFF
jgi:hypothetical protein